MVVIVDVVHETGIGSAGHLISLIAPSAREVFSVRLHSGEGGMRRRERDDVTNVQVRGEVRIAQLNLFNHKPRDQATHAVRDNHDICVVELRKIVVDIPTEFTSDVLDGLTVGAQDRIRYGKRIVIAGRRPVMITLAHLESGCAHSV